MGMFNGSSIQHGYKSYNFRKIFYETWELTEFLLDLEDKTQIEREKLWLLRCWMQRELVCRTTVESLETVFTFYTSGSLSVMCLLCK